MRLLKLIGYLALLTPIQLWGQLLKVVIVNGHDGTINSSAAQEITAICQNQGYRVTYLSGNNATWDIVRPAIQNANILIYSGHGSNKGYDGTGGLCLNGNGGEIISSYTLEEEVQLAPNALVIFKSVCGGAGSSASDNGDIGITEAVKRVSAYSRPFFNINAAAYYADNYEGSTAKFLKKMFAGQTLQAAFIENSSFWNDVEYDATLSYNNNMRVGVASEYSPGSHTRTTTTNGHSVTRTIENFKSYPVAYAGNPNFTLTP